MTKQGRSGIIGGMRKRWWSSVLSGLLFLTIMTACSGGETAAGEESAASGPDPGAAAEGPVDDTPEGPPEPVMGVLQGEWSGQGALRITAPPDMAEHGEVLVLSYRMEDQGGKSPGGESPGGGGSAPELLLEFPERDIRLLPKSGEHTLRIYPALLKASSGFPASFTIRGLTPALTVTEIAREEMPAYPAPLEADLGGMVFADQSAWRNREWEIFRWDALPEVLIFDTADYRVQARLFKRLAFYVEKPGYAGTLVRNEDLEGKHGWNAHDYRDRDLAAFFSLAEEEGFPLNPEELFLREQLLAHGIIRRGSEGYIPGEGAVLSISRQTAPGWRYRFLTHEALHALFFAFEGFREGCDEVWLGLAPEEREFWYLFFDHRGYDVNNPFLVLNEFMAHLLQQPVAEIDEYLKDFRYPIMLKEDPGRKPFLDALEESYPDSFRRAAREMEQVLKANFGMRINGMNVLVPAAIGPDYYDLFPVR